MPWDSASSGTCEVCQCPRMITDDFGLNDKLCNMYRRNDCANKENVQSRQGSPLLKQESDLSLYGNSSPGRASCDGLSPSRCSHHRFDCRQSDDHDPNSQDSGYSASCSNDGGKFCQFARSAGVVRRQDVFPTSASFGSIDSMDDEFLDFSVLGPVDDNVQLPNDFSKLITGSLNTAVKDTKKVLPKEDAAFLARPPFRRAISANNDGHTPPNSRARSCLFKTGEVDLRSFKRPEPPTGTQGPIQNKRTKIFEDAAFRIAAVPCLLKPPTAILQRSMSVSEDTIKSALQRSYSEPDLIGDFSKSFCLPLVSGRHQDLKSISANTLAMLLKGQFNNSVASYKVIDCRYPYEFTGGHIEGAINFYTKEQICAELFENSDPQEKNSSKRHILIFHCEFSSERGPNLCRFSRNFDRIRNEVSYPSLDYPEIYLLDGGYKSFYEQFPKLCMPESYKPMLHPEHQGDLRHFRTKSKTWNSDRLRAHYKSEGWKRLEFW